MIRNSNSRDTEREEGGVQADSSSWPGELAGEGAVQVVTEGSNEDPSRGRNTNRK